MSKGNKIVTFRVPPGLENKIAVTIMRRNLNTREAPWTMSDFIKKAIEEKIAHMERSRKRGGCSIEGNDREPLLHGTVIHLPAEEDQFWESLYSDMEKAEREAMENE